MVSIKDIAEECGVSTATVSKALNDHDDVNPVTKQRICDAAKRLGYLPNSMARALKTKRTYNIGVLMVDDANSGLRHHYFAAILDSFKVVMERSGYDLTFISSQIGEKTCTYYEHCMYRNVDAVLVACVDFTAPELETLMKSNLPVVSIDHISDEKYAVLSDNAVGMQELVDYASSMGHEKIAYLYGDDTQVTRARLDAFCKAMQAHGCEVNDGFLRQAKYLHPELSHKLTMSLLSEENRPTCIMYPDDICAIAGMEAIRENGLRVGTDVSVIGYDGNPILRMFRPNLTTIRQDTEEMGRKAAELMLKVLCKEEIPQDQRVQYCKGTLLKGETVATPD